ncbi:uncharacterized protein METZ01_LOCUS317490, partial [marine metagenome]
MSNETLVWMGSCINALLRVPSRAG